MKTKLLAILTVLAGLSSTAQADTYQKQFVESFDRTGVSNVVAPVEKNDNDAYQKQFVESFEAAGISKIHIQPNEPQDEYQNQFIESFELTGISNVQVGPIKNIGDHYQQQFIESFEFAFNIDLDQLKH